MRWAAVRRDKAYEDLSGDEIVLCCIIYIEMSRGGSSSSLCREAAGKA